VAQGVGPEFKPQYHKKKKKKKDLNMCHRSRLPNSLKVVLLDPL
jgi:hypothetical protein